MRWQLSSSRAGPLARNLVEDVGPREARAGRPRLAYSDSPWYAESALIASDSGWQSARVSFWPFFEPSFLEAARALAADGMSADFALEVHQVHHLRQIPGAFVEDAGCE